MKQYTLLDLQTFAAVVETGSFNKAAERLTTSTASVSRRVSALEEALDSRLLNRTTRQLHLTEAGQQYYDDLNQVLAALQESEERLKKGQVFINGHLRIAAPMSFGLQRITSLIPEFLQRHPELRVHLQLEDRETDLFGEGIDLALRIGTLRDSTLVATRICDIKLVSCASPAYLERFGHPASYQDLTGHRLLHYSLISFKDEWRISQELVDCPFSANNGHALLEAAIQGVGLLRVPRFIAEDALQKQQLQELFPQNTSPGISLYAVRLSRQFTPAKVKVFIDFLKEKLA